MELDRKLANMTPDSTQIGTPKGRSFGASMDQDRQPKELHAVQRLYVTQSMELKGFVDLCKTFEKNQVEKVAKWKEETDKLVERLEHKGRELNKCELELKNIRGKLLKCEDSKWIPEEDQSIQHVVQDLQLTIRSWAKDCSIKSFHDVLGAEEQYEESDFLRRINDYSVYKDARQFKGVKHPFLLLAAFLSEVIRVRVWGDPFFHFQNLDVEFTLSFAGGLKKMFCEMRHVDERKANSWRKDIIRHEFPDSASPLIKDSHDGELLIPKSVSEEMLKRVYKTLEAKFLSAIPKWMLKAGERRETQKTEGDLDQIFKRAGNLHFRLLTQQASFVWIPPRTQIGKRFNVHNDGLWIDQLHYLADRHDESWDDATIQIVVGTGLAALGDALGEDYSKRRVIVPARLFLKKGTRAIETLPRVDEGPYSPGQSSRRSSVRQASERKEQVPASGPADSSSLPKGNQNVAVSEQPVADAGPMRKCKRRKCEACAKGRVSCDYKTPICGRCAQRNLVCHFFDIAETKRAREELESFRKASGNQTGSTGEPGGQKKRKKRKEEEDEAASEKQTGSTNEPGGQKKKKQERGRG